MLTWPIIRSGLAYILSGKLSVKNGHLPPAEHAIAKDFIGICVSSAQDPHMDDYVVTQLRQLGINQVRLDFSYYDLEGFNARFLQCLIDEQFQITLHLVQPFANAKKCKVRQNRRNGKHF